MPTWPPARRRSTAACTSSSWRTRPTRSRSAPARTTSASRGRRSRTASPSARSSSPPARCRSSTSAASLPSTRRCSSREPVPHAAVFLAANSDLAEFIGYSEWGLYGSGLVTGLFELPVDGGTTPPAVSIPSPAAGATVPARLAATVSVTAQDQVSVASVSVLVNGTVADTLYQPPYQFQVPMPSGQPTMTLGAVATSIGGLQGTTQETL